MLLIPDIPFGFPMDGSFYDDEPFIGKVKDFAEITTTSTWRIIVFHIIDQLYFVAKALRSRFHGIENLAWYGLHVVER